MLGCVHLFSELAPEDTRALTEHSKIRTYPANTILINEGDHSDSLFVILDGRVKAYASNENGKDVTLSLMGPGEYFGELALLDDAPRSASVLAHEKTRLFAVSRADLEDLLFVDRDLAYEVLWNFVRTLSRRLRATNDKMTFLATTNKFE